MFWVNLGLCPICQGNYSDIPTIRTRWQILASGRIEAGSRGSKTDSGGVEQHKVTIHCVFSGVVTQGHPSQPAGLCGGHFLLCSGSVTGQLKAISVCSPACELQRRILNVLIVKKKPHTIEIAWIWVLAIQTIICPHCIMAWSLEWKKLGPGHLCVVYNHISTVPNYKFIIKANIL